VQGFLAGQINAARVARDWLAEELGNGEKYWRSGNEEGNGSGACEWFSGSAGAVPYGVTQFALIIDTGEEEALLFASVPSLSGWWPPPSAPLFGSRGSSSEPQPAAKGDGLFTNKPLGSPPRVYPSSLTSPENAAYGCALFC